MSNPPTPSEKAWMLATLKELAEIGMGFARDLQAGTAEPGGPAAADLALKFSRIARAVRQTVSLYGLVLEDGLVEKARVASGVAFKPPTREACEAGAGARNTGKLYADRFLKHLAPPEAIDAFKDEIAEWRADRRFDHLYAGRFDETTAEILLMLGLAVPPGLANYDTQQAYIADHAMGREQPWREAWLFLQGRPRPHLALCEGFEPPPPYRSVDKSNLALAEGP
jgi:hypothetical protein